MPKRPFRRQRDTRQDADADADAFRGGCRARARGRDDDVGEARLPGRDDEIIPRRRRGERQRQDEIARAPLGGAAVPRRLRAPSRVDADADARCASQNAPNAAVTRPRQGIREAARVEVASDALRVVPRDGGRRLRPARVQAVRRARGDASRAAAFTNSTGTRKRRSTPRWGRRNPSSCPRPRRPGSRCVTSSLFSTPWGKRSRPERSCCSR